MAGANDYSLQIQAILDMTNPEQQLKAFTDLAKRSLGGSFKLTGLEESLRTSITDLDTLETKLKAIKDLSQVQVESASYRAIPNTDSEGKVIPKDTEGAGSTWTATRLNASYVDANQNVHQLTYAYNDLLKSYELDQEKVIQNTGKQIAEIEKQAAVQKQADIAKQTMLDQYEAKYDMLILKAREAGVTSQTPGMASAQNQINDFFTAANKGTQSTQQLALAWKDIEYVMRTVITDEEQYTKTIDAAITKQAELATLVKESQASVMAVAPRNADMSSNQSAVSNISAESARLDDLIKAKASLQEIELQVGKVNTATQQLVVTNKEYVELIRMIAQEENTFQTDKANSLNKLEVTLASNNAAAKDPGVIYSAQQYQNALNGVNSSGQKVAVTSEQINKLGQRFDVSWSKAMSTTKAGLGNFVYEMGIAIQRTIEWTVAVGGLYAIINSFKDGITYMKEYNKALTDLEMVTGYSKEQASALGQSYNKLATELGTTTLEVAKNALVWQRQGKSAEDSAILMKNSMMMSKIAAIDSGEAANYLTGIMNGFQMSAKDTTSAMEKILAISNSTKTSAAVSFSELSQAMEKSSNSAKQAGITFDQLLSYIAVVSTSTRKSADSIGQSFTMMVARMENIKAGATEEGMAINDVDKVLTKHGFNLRNVIDGSIRPLGEVIDEVGQKWKTMDTFEQGQLATAIAGTRQRENFIALMSHYGDALAYQKEQLTATGLLQDRYAKYLDSTEAATNRLTAAWEKLATGVSSGGIVKQFTDFGTLLLNIVNSAGLLNTILATLAMVGFVSLKVSLADLIPYLGLYIAEMWDSIAATVSFETITGTLFIGALVLAFGSLVGAVVKANSSMKELYQTMESTSVALNSSQTDLKDLATRYEVLANKQNKSEQDIEDLINIQTILNQNYGAVTKGVDVYTAAIDNNSKAINENIKKIKELGQEQVKDWLIQNEAAYDASIRAKRNNNLVAYNENGVSVVSRMTKKEELALDLEKMATEKEADGFWHTRYASLKEEIDAGQKIITTYENQKNALALLQIQQRAAGTTPKYYQNMPINHDSQYDFATSLKNLQDAIKPTEDILASYNAELGLNGDQLSQLIKIDPDYINLVKEENGILVLNTQALKDKNIQIIQDAIDVLTAKLATDENNQSLRDGLKLLQDYLVLAKNDVGSKKAQADALKAQAEQESAYQAILKDTIDMLKNRAEQQKQALQDQLNNYKDIIDAEKNRLDQLKQEVDYQDALAQKNEDLASIETQLAALQFDNSEEAKAKRLKLEEQQSAKIKEINKAENDQSIVVQKQALDTEYDNYKKQIDDRIRAIDDYLKQTGSIEQQAKDMLARDWQGTTDMVANYMKTVAGGYDQFMKDMLAATVKNAQDAATAIESALQGVAGASFGSGLEGSNLNAGVDGGLLGQGGFTGFQNNNGGNSNSVTTSPSDLGYYGSGGVYAVNHSPYLSYHDGGTVGGLPQLQTQEEFAKLLKGEFVATPSMMDNFIGRTLPAFVSNIVGGNSSGDVQMTFNVAGSMDKSVIPDIKAMILETLNKANRNRGNFGNAFNYSL